ncbi:MAG: lytic transglycosylase domain-containing protein [Alphaproteobacteria bacterium]|nr:lytic transglycosylase domain-containing protein [Alphaproteobacteria bacterium]
MVAFAGADIPLPPRKPELIAHDIPLPARKPDVPETEKLARDEFAAPSKKLTSAQIREDKARANKAAAALYSGKLDEAYSLAVTSLKRSHSHVPLAGWVAGLAAWQRGEYELAAKVFEIAAAGEDLDPWTHSAAAYWAARAHSRADGKTSTVRHYLEAAAAQPQTFYGLLAARALGRDLHAQTAAHVLPVKGWMKKTDYKIDPALVHAIVNQESRFNARAKSPKGAQGLMQILPGTARDVIGKKRINLFEPHTNLKIGQRYLQTLLEDQSVQGDLTALLMAYNAGPGNLARWRTNMADIDDPLLFIEMIPISETRAYVERVMAGYWLYRLRDRMPNPSMDALAAGRPAQYPMAADWQSVSVAER